MLKLVDISAILDILLQVSDKSYILDILDILWQLVLNVETSIDISAILDIFNPRLPKGGFVATPLSVFPGRSKTLKKVTKGI